MELVSIESAEENAAINTALGKLSHCGIEKLKTAINIFGFN
jgi:hypothetical protein